MNHLFTRLFRTFLLSALVLFGAGIPQALASHYGQIDMWVDFIGADSTELKYRVTLQLYKCCEGVGGISADLSTSEGLTVSSTQAGIAINRVFQATNLHVASFNYPNPIPPLNHGPFDTLDRFCDNVAPLDLCRQPFVAGGSNYPAVVRATYIDTISLPVRATDWKFVWTSGARGSNIQNLSPNQGSMWCEAMLNNLEPGRWNNSSPRYNVPPLYNICVNRPYRLVNGPTEIGADTTVDSMYTVNSYPQNAGGANFGYVPGYSFANPIAAAMPAGYYVDPATAIAYFIPTVTGNFTLAFRTFEYDRNSGALMGYVSRDFQTVVMPCSVMPPVIHFPPINLTGGTLQTDSFVSIPVNQAVSFDIGARVLTLGSTIRLYASNSVSAPGSQFTVAYPSPDSALGHFTWTPGPAQIGSHILALYTLDSTCNPIEPYVTYAYRDLVLQVVGPSGIGSVTNRAAIKVWPNPAGKLLFIEGDRIRRAELLSITGQLAAVYESPSGGLDISSLAPGMYVVRITSGSTTEVARFIKE